MIAFEIACIHRLIYPDSINWLLGIDLQKKKKNHFPHFTLQLSYSATLPYTQLFPFPDGSQNCLIDSQL